jgi:hypothetical protein
MPAPAPQSWRHADTLSHGHNVSPAVQLNALLVPIAAAAKKTVRIWTRGQADCLIPEEPGLARFTHYVLHRMEYDTPPLCSNPVIVYGRWTLETLIRLPSQHFHKPTEAIDFGGVTVICPAN